MGAVVVHAAAFFDLGCVRAAALRALQQSRVGEAVLALPGRTVLAADQRLDSVEKLLVDACKLHPIVGKTTRGRRVVDPVVWVVEPPFYASGEKKRAEC